MVTPFAVDSIPAGKSIIGRTKEIESVVSVIDELQKSAVIYDAPRSGKETIVMEALDWLKKKDSSYIVCCIDLFNIRNFSDFIKLWKEKMKEYAGAANEGAIFSFDIDIDSISDRKALELPNLIAGEALKTLIIYFKSFHNFLAMEDDSFKLDWMSQTFSRHKHARYIFTGSFMNPMKTIFEDRKLFYGMTHRVELLPLDKKEICEYISQTFLNYGRVIESEECMAIYELASGNMWYIKQICSTIFEMPAGYINRSVVNQARDTVISIHEPRFNQIVWDLTGHQINFLKAIIDGVKKFASSEILETYNLNSSANVVRIKDALQKKEVIAIDSDDKVRILDPLFEYWFRNIYL